MAQYGIITQRTSYSKDESIERSRPRNSENGVWVLLHRKRKGWSFTPGSLPRFNRSIKTNGFGGNQHEGISGLKGIQARFLLTSLARSSYE